MGLFDFKGARSASGRLADEALYAEALREIESGVRRDGIWARALSECTMDQAKAAARYIELRVQAMKDELTLRAKEDEIERLGKSQRENEWRQRQISDAEADLPRHPRCGGIIDRQEQSGSMRWKCRKCKKTGQFTIGAV